MIRVRPVVYTARPAKWRAFLTALGLAGPGGDETWTVHDAASGRVAVHTVPADSDLDGTVALGFESDDLDRIRETASAAGVSAAIVEQAHGVAVEVTDAAGSRFLVDAAGEQAVHAPRAGLSVMQIRYQPDTAEARRILSALGLRPRVSSDAGIWFDCTADGGGIGAVHGGETSGVELAFEFAGDLEGLRDELADAGIVGAIVDESYNRTLRLQGPGGEVWVNGTQDDLYGYRLGE